MLISSNCFFTGCSENLPPERYAAEIVKDSYVLSKDKTVYRFIEEFIRQKGDDVKPGSWNAEKMTDNKYLVSYKYKLHSFNEGVGERGFFFEVDLSDELVIDRTKEYLEKMKPLSKIYNNEKEILREIISEEGALSAVE